MSELTFTDSSFKKEKTFASYSKDQGSNYAKERFGYHSKLYKIILDFHTSSDGQLGTLLDIGCGPGTATRDFAPNFIHAIGLDPSNGMIETARSLNGQSASESIRYEVSSAEELGSNLVPPIVDSSVDIITAATAAHWFDIPNFWKRAAQVLKPGGTVAIWSNGPIRVHPSTPNAVAIQTAMEEYEKLHLESFMAPGNLISHNLYRDLPLPWTIKEPVLEFDKSTFVRKEWNGDSNEEYFAGTMEVNMDMMEKVWSTASPVTRWREANPNKVGTEEDVIRIMRRETERLLHEGGMEKGKEIVKGIPTAVLLMVKKKL